MTVVVSDRKLREMVPVLREFEGNRCIWRVPVATATLLLTRGVPVAAAAAAALLAIQGRVLSAAVGAVIALVFEGIRRSIEVRIPWRAAVANRLWTFERPNPATELEVLIRQSDAGAARRALRRAKFNPQAYELILALPPNDAPDLNHKLRVQEPARWMQSQSDDDRICRIASALKRAGIKGRVGGIDTF